MSGQSVRYAPSPTGGLHIGNLRTAWVASHLAQHFDFKLVCRFENMDPLRSKEEYIDQQKQDLKHLGLSFDEFELQSNNYSRHLDYFQRARKAGFIYPCF